MARYDTFKYGSGKKYGATQSPNLLWGIMFDWDGDGFFETNEARRVIGLSVERGRDRFLDFTGNALQFPTVGRCTITLDDHERRFDAWHTSSPLYGKVAPGVFVRIFVRNGSGGTDYPIFAGIIKDIKHSGRKNQRVNIELEDGLQWLYDNDIDIDVAQGLRVDQAIAQILERIKYPTIWGTDLDLSTEILNYWWGEGSASRNISNLTQTGIGYFAVAADGRARFRNRSSVGMSKADLSDGNTLDQVILPQPWDYYKNIVRVRFYPRVKQSSGVVWKLDTVPQIGAGATFTVFGDYSFLQETRIPAVNVAIPPGNFTANSLADGSGTNLTANISVTFTNFGTNAKIEVTNNGAVPAFLTLLQVSGEAISAPNPGAIQREVLDHATKPRRFTLDLPWQQNTNSAEDIATVLAEFLSTQNAYPVVQVEARPEVQFAPDLFDSVYYESDHLGIGQSFRVGGIRHEWINSNGQAVRTTFRLEPYITGVTAWTFDVTNFGASGTGGTTFG